MRRYTLGFEKKVWGWIFVEANSLEEAKTKFSENDYDEQDNESEYTYDRKEGELDFQDDGEAEEPKYIESINQAEK